MKSSQNNVPPLPTPDEDLEQKAEDKNNLSFFGTERAINTINTRTIDLQQAINKTKDELSTLSEQTYLSQDQLKQLNQSLKQLIEQTKNVEKENNNRLEPLKHLQKLDKIDDLKYSLSKLEDIVPANQINELLTKQNEELRYLKKLDDLSKLDKLDHLGELEYLEHLKKLESLKDLQKLNNLSSLSELQNIEKLNELKQLHSLEQLSLLSKLDNLSQLVQMERLENLENLDKLSSLDSLSSLEKLQQLNQLGELDKLEGLSSLENLNRLENLESLAQLESLKKLEDLDKLSLLKDDKVAKALQKIDNISIFKDKFAIYLGKSFFNTLFDFIKVAALSALVVYLIINHSNALLKSRFLPALGFSGANQINLAMTILESSSSSEEYKKYESFVQNKIKSQITDFFQQKRSSIAANPAFLSRLENLQAYSFSTSNKFVAKTFVKDTLNKKAEQSLQNFYDLYNYYYEKNGLTKENEQALKQIYLLYKNGKFQKALEMLAPMKGLNENLEGQAITYGLFKLYQEDPKLAQSIIMKRL